MEKQIINMPWETLLVPLAQRAGNAVISVYKDDFTVQMKIDNSPITTADTRSHTIIKKCLEKTTPTIPILSEECPVSFDEREGWNVFWLVDPLDGTKEFIKRNGEFTVNIALVVNGRPVAGVVHAPAMGVTYYGQGDRALMMSMNKKKQIHATQQMSALRVVVSRSHTTDETMKFVKMFGQCMLVFRGSSLKFCNIADGTADIYPRFAPTMEWDTAAGQAILEAAGGWVRDITGKQLLYNKKDLTNPHFIAGCGENSFIQEDNNEKS